MTEEQLVALLVTVLQPTVLLSIAGGILSVITSYVYGFREWYAALPPETKGLGQVFMCTVVVVIVGILSWTRILQVVPADKLGFFTLVISWIGAIVSNQTVYQVTKSNQVSRVMVIKEQAYKETLIEAKAEVKADEKESKMK